MARRIRWTFPDARAFLADFAERLELDVALDAVSLQPRNVSYSLPIVRLARLLNRFTYRTVNDKRYWIDLPRWYSIRRHLLESLNGTGWLGRTPSAEVLLGEGEVREIEDRFRSSNRALADHTRLPLGELGYPV
jgi:hypothetical protein